MQEIVRDRRVELGAKCDHSHRHWGPRFWEENQAFWEEHKRRIEEHMRRVEAEESRD